MQPKCLTMCNSQHMIMCLTMYPSVTMHAALFLWLILIYVVFFCMFTHKRLEKVKLHSGAIRQDTRSKYTHFLNSHIRKPAAPEETNNGLVITPRQHTKELLTRNSSDFTTEKHAHLPIQFMSDNTKGLPKEWRLVQISPHLLPPTPHVVSLLEKLDVCYCMIKLCVAIVLSKPIQFNYTVQLFYAAKHFLEFAWVPPPNKSEYLKSLKGHYEVMHHLSFCF